MSANVESPSATSASASNVGSPISATPAAAGFRMPGEWVKHTRTWMAWPCRIDLWHGLHREAKEAYAAVAKAIVRFEPLTMVARPEDVAEVKDMCGPAVDVLAMPLDDSWMRDHGPTFLIGPKGELAANDWIFNAWGMKHEGYEQDDLCASRIISHLGIRGFKAPFVLEGGSIHTDGEGTILTTESCLLSPNRNPTLTKDEIEANLLAYLGAEKVIWLGPALENDNTDGHVDNIACFARPGVVLATSCTDEKDKNYAVCQENIARLRAAKDAKGRPLEVLELPLPKPRHSAVGRHTSNYCNFYFCNGGVVVPTFDDPNDEVAAAVLRKAFPDRELVQVPARYIIEGGGGIHCITQQQPAVVAEE